MKMTQRTTVLIAAALVLSAPALAGTPFSSSVLNTPSAVGGGTLFQRYFSPGSTGVSLDCSTNCGPAGCATTDGQETCQLTTRNASGGYLGYDSNSDNYYPAGTGDGNFFESVMDAQANAGTGNHVGYFAWTGKVVNSTDSSKKTDTNCAGVHSASCLGNANSNNSVGRSMVPNADGGASGVDRFGGLSPIPAPRIVSYDTTTRTIQLEWDTAQSNTGGLTAVGYDLYAFTGLVVAGSCPAPNETQLSFLRAVTGTSTAVTRAELGSVAGDNKCAVFALRPTLANIVNGTVKTRFLSQNGQSIALDGSASATTVSSLQAQWMNAATVEVRWTTSLEDGVRGFYVGRAKSASGTFVRVSNLIAARGEPSVYNFVDAIPSQPARSAASLYYRLEVVDVDDTIGNIAPVKARLPLPSKRIIDARPDSRPQR